MFKHVKYGFQNQKYNRNEYWWKHDVTVLGCFDSGMHGNRVTYFVVRGDAAIFRCNSYYSTNGFVDHHAESATPVQADDLERMGEWKREHILNAYRNL